MKYILIPLFKYGVIALFEMIFSILQFLFYLDWKKTMIYDFRVYRKDKSYYEASTINFWKWLTMPMFLYD